MKCKKKKLLWQTHEAIVSGANIAMLEYIDALEHTFQSLVILPHEGNMQAALDQRGVPYTIINQYGWTDVHPWWQLDKWIKIFARCVVAIWQTMQLINKERPSIVSTNTLVPFTASVAAYLLRVPHVWWIHEFGREDFGFTTGWGFEKASLRWMQHSSKLIIGNSTAITAKFGKLMPKVKITTIYQPVSWNVTSAKTKEARFLMFGQLVSSKGHKDVLQAMLVNKQKGKLMHTLHIKGPSNTKSYLDELQDFVLLNDLQRYVQIETGYFIKEDIIPCYEVLIVASQSEAFGRVIVEANKAGLHVLVRNRGGAPELVNDSNGLLFNNQDELAAALSGEKTFPNTAVHVNYCEVTEIQKLTELLIEVCSQNSHCLQ